MAAVGKFLRVEVLDTGTLTMEPQNANVETDKPLIVPILVCAGVVSVICSLFISNYLGMGLAIGTVIVSSIGLKDVSRSTWNLVLGLAAIGFFLGLAALLMKLFLINAGA